MHSAFQLKEPAHNQRLHYRPVRWRAALLLELHVTHLAAKGVLCRSSTARLAKFLHAGQLRPGLGITKLQGKQPACLQACCRPLRKCCRSHLDMKSLFTDTIFKSATGVVNWCSEDYRWAILCCTPASSLIAKDNWGGAGEPAKLIPATTSQRFVRRLSLTLERRNV